MPAEAAVIHCMSPGLIASLPAGPVLKYRLPVARRTTGGTSLRRYCGLSSGAARLIQDFYRAVPLQPTAYYQTHLATLHRQLLAHAVVQTYLTGSRIRYDGEGLVASNRFELPLGELSTLEFAHLFSVFDGSRVHQQAQKDFGPDDAPPGLYFTVINNKVIQGPHKNRLGLFAEEIGTTDLFIDGLHIDHYFLNEHQTPRNLGTFAFTLCAITAHLAGLGHVSLVAAGGQGFNKRHVGFKVWPKLGFDADLLAGETAGAPYLEDCQTVQSVLALDPAWWDTHGSQRLMTFDLSASSTSWEKLIIYATGKVSAGDAHE